MIRYDLQLFGGRGSSSSGNSSGSSNSAKESSAQRTSGGNSNSSGGSNNSTSIPATFNPGNYNGPDAALNMANRMIDNGNFVTYDTGSVANPTVDKLKVNGIGSVEVSYKSVTKKYKVTTLDTNGRPTGDLAYATDKKAAFKLGKDNLRDVAETVVNKEWKKRSVN